MRRIIGLTLLIAMTVSTSVLAGQENGGLAASYVTPKGDFAETVDDGWGTSAIFDYPLSGIINMTGSLGWYTFSGITLVEGTNVKTDSRTMWEFVAGPQADFGMLYIGVEAGYYTDLNEWGVVPNAGIRKNMIDVGVRYTVTDDGEFMAIRIGFFF